MRFALVLILLATHSGIVCGQTGEEFDTASNTTAIAVADSLQTADSALILLALTIEDSIRLVYPSIDPDTLTEAQRLLAEFETRFTLRQIEQRQIELQPEFSFFDSLVNYYITPRWNLREDIDRSFYHDAGDYFKSEPSFFVLEPQVTPMRKTVQPYGLSGNRTGLLIGDQPLRPFEHIPEPDGLVDFNDIPTALDHTVAVLPGPVGMVFGGDHSVATLLTRPQKPAGNDPESSFLVDKGSFAFSHARGKYSKDFVSGRRIDLSLGYRNADGLVFGRGDDSYHYTGKLFLPLGQTKAVRFSGRLYNRNGPYPVRPLVGGKKVKRGRFDRDADLTFIVHNEGHTAKYEIGYVHLRQGSQITEGYLANLNQTGHGLHLAREWMWGGFAVRSSLKGDYLQLDTWHKKHERLSGSATLSLARLSRPIGMAVDLRQIYVEGYRFLPSLAAMVRRETEQSYLMLSGGYSERAPSLYELYLPSHSTDLYNLGTRSYADGGNSDLISEKQLVGGAEFALGRATTGIRLSAAGGRIWDGIDWRSQAEGSQDVFRPVNGDIEWGNVAATVRLGLSDLLRFKGGGSYHFLDYENFGDKAYAPEYQFFSGMELHLFWSQKLIDLWAYGELQYVGPYHGLVQNDLGEEVVANIKLSFKMGHFRFHWISQNALSVSYHPKDHWVNLGRYNSYGFTWDFID